MVIGVWLKVGVVEWLISIMSVDKHSADGARTQACVTQQEVSLLPLAAFPMSDCTSPTRSSLPGLILPHISAIFFYPLDSFTKFIQTKKKKKKKSIGTISPQICSLNLEVTWKSRAVHQTQERLCFLLRGSLLPPSQLCGTQKLATLRKHNHLRTCNKCRGMGKWPHCQLAKDKRVQICESTVLNAFWRLVYNKWLFLSLQSSGGSKAEMSMDRDSDF